jgi:hypothetical protein
VKGADRGRRAVRLALAAAVMAGALWQLSLELRLWAGRVRYPWDVEWLESSAMYQFYRVMRGLPTYGSPRDGYLSLNHPPGYFMAMGLLGRLFGLDYPMVRTLSLLFYLAAGALVARAVVRRHKGSLEGFSLGALAVGIGLAGAPVCGTFYDLVRGDTMALFLCVLTATLADTVRRLPGPRIALLALTITAVVYTRYPAVFFPVWVTIFVSLRHRRSGLLLALAATACCGLCLVWLQFASGGWFWILTVALVQHQPVAAPRVWLTFETLLRFAPFVVVLPPAACALAARRRLSRQSVLWLGMLAASIPASLFPFAKVGGFSNDLIPAVFMMGPATAFVAGDAIDALSLFPLLQRALQALILVGGAAFLFVRTWSAAPFLPTADMFQRARALNARVASLSEGVIASRHPFLPPRNGDPTPQWSDMPYLDLWWAGYTDTNLGSYIDRGHAHWALVSGTELPTTARELSLRYQLDERIADPPSTIVGEESAMRYLLRANDEEKSSRLLFDFESLDGWTLTGNAFQLTPASPAWEQPIQGVIGRHVANSYAPRGRDSARGIMLSPRFIIDRPHLSLRVGGGWHTGTRAELRVGDRIEESATGIFESQETLTRVVWDVSRLQGQEAQLALVDDDAGPWGHLICDHAVLF